MPVITVGNPKGGSGKSTTTLVLSTTLAAGGASVCVLDADPNLTLSDWKQQNPKSTVEVFSGVKENTILDMVEELSQKFDFVFVDLEGTASLVVSRGIAIADLVLIPLQPSGPDVKNAAKAIEAVRSEEKFQQRIDPKTKKPYRVIMVRTPAPGAPVSTLQRELEAEITSMKTKHFNTKLAERQAYKTMMTKGKTLQELEAIGKAGNIQGAIENATELTNELLQVLTEIQKEKEVAA